MLLEVAFLAGGERVVDENQIGVSRNRSIPQLVGLAGAHEKFGSGRSRRAVIVATGTRTRRGRQLRELLQVLRIDRCAQPKTHQHRALTRAWAFDHGIART